MKLYKIENKPSTTLVGKSILYRFNEKIEVGNVVAETNDKIMPLFFDNFLARMLKDYLEKGYLNFVYNNGNVGLVPSRKYKDEYDDG